MNVLSICIGCGVMFYGILFFFGRAHIYLSAWKYMCEEEKNKIDIKSLCRNIGMMIFMNGSIFIVNGIVFKMVHSFLTVAMILWVMVAGLDVWLIIKNQYKV